MDQVVVVPILEELFEPGPPGPPHPFNGPATGRSEADSGGPAIVGVGMTDDHLLAFELLDLAGHRGGVHTEHLGQVGDPERFGLGRELEEGGWLRPGRRPEPCQ